MEFKMNLHTDLKLFRQAIQYTSDQMQIPAIYVEKDYWVTFALYTIVKAPIGKETIFKGGTALSKCYKLIERFSEDIDLVVVRNVGETDSKLKSKLKEISNSISKELPEVAIEGITRKMGMNRKTAHSYNKLFSGQYGQVRDILILESSWLGYYEPFSKKSIISFIGAILEKNQQNETVQNYGLQSFEMNVLEPSRTICEKIMSLVRFSYTETPIQDLKNKIRHTYDIYQLLQQPEFKEFVASEEFTKMLIKVANDDVISFRNNNVWLTIHPNESLFFKEIEKLWKSELMKVYTVDFKNLVYGELPKENEVLENLKYVRDRMAKIKWDIKVK
jgi:hypothetical protein